VTIRLWLSSVTVIVAALGVRAAVPEFKVQEIETGLGVGYAVTLVDVNGDGKRDIVVVDKTRVVWYENPTWKRRNIIDNQTTPDNVCIAPYDVDGDGRIDFALGAGWGNLSSTVPGPLYWLKRGKSLDDNWTVYPIGEENSVHRIRWADLDGDGKADLIVGPLLGTKSSKEKNYMDVPIRTLAFKIPRDPTKDRWVPEVIDETLHVMHNFWPVPAEGRKGMDILTASYEGVCLLKPDADGRWKPTKLGMGNQDNPNSNRGASEIKRGTLKGGRQVIATVEPWHGHQVVVYTPPLEQAGSLWTRQVVDEQLKWGHAVWFADLDGDGGDELIIGVRDNLGAKAGEKCGVRIYKAEDGTGTKWTRTLIDEGGVAVEDLAAADLDSDGRVDIVAVGRQTKNARIYWNQFVE
jgi:hypothetical protein